MASAPTQAQGYSSEDLAQRTIERRAIEAVTWGMPAVNLDLMLQAMIGSAKGKPNQIVYWSRLPDWKNQTLTPNPDVIYLMPFFNTKDAGPMVLEIPPANGGVINGTVMDAWQVPLEDVGPAGVDKGKGGKYLILPPKHSAAIPDGYIALPSMNYQGYALLLDPQERQRCRRRHGGRLCQANQVVSALAGGESTCDDLRRRDRCRLRLHDSLRSAFLPFARPRSSDGAMARARQTDDRHPQVGRH